MSIVGQDVGAAGRNAARKTERCSKRPLDSVLPRGLCIVFALADEGLRKLLKLLRQAVRRGVRLGSNRLVPIARGLLTPASIFGPLFQSDRVQTHASGGL